MKLLSGVHAAAKVAVAVVGASLFVPSRAAQAAAQTDLTLQVNILTGDVTISSNVFAVAFTGYNIVDADSDLLSGGSPDPALLLSAAPGSPNYNPTPYRSNTNYKYWSVLEDDSAGLSEGQIKAGYNKSNAATFDTINIPAAGSVDLGDVYNPSTNAQDLTFQFSEANASTGVPTAGPTYNGVVTYVGAVGAPEPGSLMLVSAGAIGMLGRRRRS